MRLLVVQRIVGAVTGLSAIVMIPPWVLAFAYGEPYTHVYAESLLVVLGVGLALWLPVRRAREELRLRDGFLITAAIWVLVSATCAVPFVLGPTQLSITDAYFESVSGLTTTGITVIEGLDELPKSILFYRQLLCFLGGMGIVILAVAILPMLRIGGSQLFRAESTGPVKDAKLTPRIGETARALWFVYVGLNLACFLAFWAGGMDVFDAVGHAFATVATGGFSSHDASFGYFDSPLLEMIAAVFMFLGSTSFALHYLAWRRASATAYFADPEFRAFFAISFAVVAMLSFGLYATGTAPSLADAVRLGVFHGIANITTTGFFTDAVYVWPGFAPMLLVLIAFVGGCSGSTAGGMKVARVLMLFRQGAREILQLVHPRGRFVVKLGGVTVSGAVLAAVTGFCTLYVFSYVVLSMAMAASGEDLVTSWSAVAACINNVGTALGNAGPHFRDLNPVATWICTLAMILGRLEVFTVLVLFTPTFWRE